MKEIVSVAWLNQNQNDDNLIILDSSLKSTVDGSSSAYENSAIKGARYFDLKNNFSDTNSQFPNTIPSAEQFESECQKLGINNTSKIVVYDNKGIYASPRVWWLFKAMGHQEVYVLDGGLPEWVKEGHETVPKENRDYELGNFKSSFQKHYVKSYKDILDNVATNSFCVIDARSSGRFLGTEKEPRKHLQSGHIPNSANIPYQEVLKDGKFKSLDELKNIFANKCDDKKDLVFSCGSGLTACIIMLACYMTYKQDSFIYDGSWTEWAELQNLKDDIV